MKTTIVGRLADRDGFVVKDEVAAEAVVGGHLRAWHQRTFHAVGAMEYRSTQPRHIGVNVAHDDQEIGRVLHLERVNGQLWMVAELDRPERVPVEARFLSAGITMADGGHDVELEHVALTADPASVSALPVHELAGDLRTACRGAWRLKDRFLQGLLEHARDSKVGTTTIAGEVPAPTQRAWPIAERTAGTVVVDGEVLPVEIRPAKIVAVNGRPVTPV